MRRSCTLRIILEIIQDHKGNRVIFYPEQNAFNFQESGLYEVLCFPPQNTASIDSVINRTSTLLNCYSTRKSHSKTIILISIRKWNRSVIKTLSYVWTGYRSVYGGRPQSWINLFGTVFWFIDKRKCGNLKVRFKNT